MDRRVVAGWAVFVFIVVGGILLVIALTQGTDSGQDSTELVQTR